MNLYFYIRTWLCISSGYKKKNTWQRARAARQVQSFHSKHICVCWASVALGRQRGQQLLLPCRASDYQAQGERWVPDSCRCAGICSGITQGSTSEMGQTRKKPSSMLTVAVWIPNAFPPWRKQPGDTTTKAHLSVVLCFVEDFKIIILFICFWGAVPWEGSDHALPLQKYLCWLAEHEFHGIS